MDPNRPYLVGTAKAAASSRYASPSMETSASLSASIRELAYVRRHPIEGRTPVAFRTRLSRPAGPASTGKSVTGSGPSGGLSAAGINGQAALGGLGPGPGGGNAGGGVEGKQGDFLYYSDSDEEDEVRDPYLSETDRVSCNFADCMSARETGLPNLAHGRFWTQRLSSEYGTRHMLANSMLKESPASIPQMNKVFCSQWLSHRQVVFGTKCNKLMVYDVNTRFMDQIPSLQSSENSIPPDQECGIHAIEINPSRTLLATGAKNANDAAFYRLPTLDPICVGEGAHGDWIFDMTWLDDQFLVSGSRDGSLALWRITDDIVEQVTSSDIPSFVYSKPLIKKPCKTADRVRAMCFNSRRSELAVISTNGYIHCWDALRFKQVMSKRLPHNMENVCLGVDDDSFQYAVGSKAHTDLLDARTLQKIRNIPSRNQGCGIRSVSFKGNILTIGTGTGIMLFWDLRAHKFLESTMNSNRAVSLKVSKGWWQRDDNFVQNIEMMQQGKNVPAIYTHCYDTSGTRLFAAGGPLQCGLRGNYVGLFQ